MRPTRIGCWSSTTGAWSSRGTVDDIFDLAGGRWRLRLIGVEFSVDAWARTHGVELVEAGDTRVLISDRQTVAAMAEQIEAARDRGDLHYQDILKGPIQLEDVFAEAVSQANQEVVLCLWTWVTVLCQDIGDTSVGSGGDTCGLRLSGEL